MIVISSRTAHRFVYYTPLRHIGEAEESGMSCRFFRELHSIRRNRPPPCGQSNVFHDGTRSGSPDALLPEFLQKITMKIAASKNSTDIYRGVAEMGLMIIDAVKSKEPLPQKRNDKKRFRWFLVPKIFLALVALLVGLTAFAIWGGPLATDIVAFGAKKYLSRMQNLSVAFEKFGGSLFDGYELHGLTVGDKNDPAIVAVRKIFVAVDAEESWRRRKVILRGELEGLRVTEDRLTRLAAAAQKEFPPARKASRPDEKSLPILSIVTPRSFAASDLSGSLGWKVERLSVEQPEPDKLAYALELDADYLKERIRIGGTFSVTETGLPERLDLRLRALQSDVQIQASLKDGQISLKKLEGTLLGAPVTGSASIDAASRDPRIAADLTLQKVDFKPLRKWIPGLGASTLESLRAHIAGTLARPTGTIALKNGDVAYKKYRADNVEGVVELNGVNVQATLSADLLGSPLSIGGSLGLTPDAALNMKATMPSLALKNLASWFPETAGAGLDGTLRAKLGVTGTLAQPKARLSIRLPRLTVQKQYVVSNIEANVLAGPKELTVENLTANVFKGRVQLQGTVGLAGTTPAFDLNGLAERIDLGTAVPGGTVAGTFHGKFHLKGTAAKPEIALDSRIDKLDSGQFGVKEVALNVSGGSEKMNVEIKGLTKRGAPFGGGGTLLRPLDARRSSLDLRLDVEKMDLTEILPNTMKFAGSVTAALLVNGSLEKPRLSAELESEEIQVGGFKIVNPKGTAELKDSRVDVKASIAVGDRRPEIIGTVDFKKGMKGAFDVTAPTVRLDALDPSLASVADGRVSLAVHSEVDGSGVSFTGQAASPLITAAQVPVSNVLIPFAFRQNKVHIPDGQFELGGGAFHVKADGDVAKGTYSVQLNGKDIDLNRLAAPFAPPAQIAGKSDVSFRGAVRSGLTTLVQGDGRIRVRDVVVDKYPGQLAVTGKDPFKIQHGNVFFNVNDGEVFVLPGSAITAWPDDKFFNFVSFTGTAWKRARALPKLDPALVPKDLLQRGGNVYHMLVSGSVNMRVLNGLLGGLGAVMQAGVSGNVSAESLASNFLQKFIGGSLAAQFRDFDLEVSGKDYGEFNIGLMKFGGEGSYADVAATNWTEDAGQKKTYQRYSLSYPLPVGPDPAKLKTKNGNGKKK